jgi:IS4 transposase
VDFKFIHAVFDRGSDLVVRLKSDTKFVTTEERAITDADRGANVVSDRIGHVPGSAGSPGFGDKPLREVILTDPRSGKPVRLLTNLLDVPARIIGLIYRHRWMIEIFFKWLKCTARLRHLISESQNGITLQLYVAVIGVLLTHLRTGRRPSLYAANCLAMVATGQMSTATMFRILQQRDHEKDLERARLARKRAEKTVR